MSQVIALPLTSPAQRRQQARAGLLHSFAAHRRVTDDVFWLKENAEILNILECTGAPLAPSALAAYRPFHAEIEARLSFFPQYYRFLLSICLDLEALGLDGGKAERLIAWAQAQGLAQAELSDLQRAEARRLMLRHGVDPMAGDPGLDDRLRRFAERGATFALPNKKAAYELTHIVFYLSEYGRRDPVLSDAAIDSLHHAGTLAFLEGNADLLAEVCIALHYSGRQPPHDWESWLAGHTRAFHIASDPPSGQAPQDDYHEYLVCNWLLSTTGDNGFSGTVPAGRIRFSRPQGGANALRELSAALFDLADRRRCDWQAMKPCLTGALSPAAHETLAQAEQAIPDFDRFFAIFARAQAVA